MPFIGVPTTRDSVKVIIDIFPTLSTQSYSIVRLSSLPPFSYYNHQRQKHPYDQYLYIIFSILPSAYRPVVK